MWTRGRRTEVLGFADDLNLIDSSKENVVKNSATFIDEAKTVELSVN